MDAGGCCCDACCDAFSADQAASCAPRTPLRLRLQARFGEAAAARAASAPARWPLPPIGTDSETARMQFTVRLRPALAGRACLWLCLAWRETLQASVRCWVE